MSTLWPGRMSALRRYPSAVRAPNMTAAASSSAMLAGLRPIRPSSARQTNSAWAPSLNKGEPNTSSPGKKRVTLAPAASITPDSSIPRMR